MAINPVTKEYGIGHIGVENSAGTGQINLQMTASGGAYPGRNLAHDSVSVTFTPLVNGTGVAPPAPVWAIALVEDGVDPAGEYTTADNDTSLATGVLAFASGISITNPTVLTYPAGKHGMFRIIVIAADRAASARRISQVNTGGASIEYHHDSDQNTARGGLAVVITNDDTATRIRTGYLWKETYVDLVAYSQAGNLRYGHTFTVQVSMKAGTYINPKAMKGAFRTVTADGVNVDQGDGSTAGAPYRATPNSSGVVTFGVIASESNVIRVDTDFAASQTDHYFHVGVNAALGDSTTPSGELPAFLTSGSISGTTTSQRSWIQFTPSVNGTDFTNADRNRSRSTGTKRIASGFSIYQDSGQVTPGAKAYSSSAYTTAQDLFRRPEVTATSHAIPFLETFVVDAYGNLLSGLSFLGKVRTQNASPQEENSQSVTSGTGGTVGRLRWNYTIGATHAAFNRFFEPGIARVAGSHATTGPDDPASPPATFLNLAKTGSDKTGNHPNPKGSGTLSYDGAQPAYPKTVRVTGNVFTTKEPVANATSVFGVNSEVFLEGMWTGDLGQAVVNANNEPTGTATRSKNLGTGALRYKVSSEIDESTKTLKTLGEFNPCDVAGRLYSVSGSDAMKGRRAAWNITTSTRHEAPTDDANSNYHLTGTLGYNAGTGGDNGFQSLAAPSDPGTLAIYYGYSPATATAQSFDLNASAPEQAGFNTDSGVFGYFRQVVGFIAVNPNYLIIVVVEKLIYPPDVSEVRIMARFLEFLPNGDVTPVKLDEPARIYISKDGGAGSAIEEVVANVQMDAIDPDINGKSANWEYFFDAPDNGSYSVAVSGLIQGSRPTGPGQTIFIVGESDPDISLLVDVGHSGTAHDGKHLIAGLPIEVNVIGFRESTGTLIDLDTGADQPKFALFRKNLIEYLAADLTWKNVITQGPVFFHSPTLNVAEKRWATTFETDSSWGVSDVVAVGRATYLGAPYEDKQFREFTGARFQHDRLTDSFGVRVATVGANITLSGLQTIDGISLLAGDKILVKDQTNGIENGIYVVASGAWTRDETFNATVGVVAGTDITAKEGTLNSDTVWLLANNDPITVGTDALVFRLLAPNPDYVPIVSGGSTKVGRHMTVGDSVGFTVSIYNSRTKQLETLTNPRIVVGRNTSGRYQYLNAAETAWVDLIGAAVADEHAMTETGAGNKLYSKVFVSTGVGGLWTNRDLQVIVLGEIGGVPYKGDASVEVVDPINPHDVDIDIQVDGGNVSRPGRHFLDGDTMTIGAVLLDASGKVSFDAGTMECALLILDSSIGSTRYLDATNAWVTGDAFHWFAMSPSPGDAKLALLNKVITLPAGLKYADIYIVARGSRTDPGTTSVFRFKGKEKVTVVDSKFQHDDIATGDGSSSPGMFP